MKTQRLLLILMLIFIGSFLLVSCFVPYAKIAYPTPADNSKVFSKGVTLFWDHFEYFESFDIWFGESMEDLQKIDTISNNFYELSELEWGKKYYWKVVGYKTGKNTVESPLWSFSVGNPHKGLLIGINDYDSASDLDLTDNDALDLKVALEATVFGYEINTLVGRVLKADILQVLDTIEDMDEESVFTFSYAGHGGYSMAEKESYLYLSDGYKLHMSELRTLLQTIPGKKTVIIDACNSGSFTELLPGRELDNMNRQFNEGVIGAFAQTTREGENEFYVMTGSNTTQSSWENSKLENGVFSFFLLDGIGDVGINNPKEAFDSTFDADFDKDGKITLHEAYSYAAPKVEHFVNSEFGYHQAIQVFPTNSDFVISQW